MGSVTPELEAKARKIQALDEDRYFCECCGNVHYYSEERLAAIRALIEALDLDS
jgi:hypothetical protein